MSTCRFCNTPLNYTAIDLGVSPLCQSQIAPDRLDCMEPFYPLKAMVCDNCHLMQLDEFVAPDEIFGEYAYFSSFSDSWVAHAKRYAHRMIDMLSLNSDSLVTEVASNDGYLLQHFLARDIPVLGIEPAANVAQTAIEKGISTEIQFLGEESAAGIVAKHGRADLVLGNNVLAHVPQLNDFVIGIRSLMKDGAVLTMEFPHLQNLIEQNQYDTIYHEHFSYYSFIAVQKLFTHHGITLFDVEELPTHGGSLRIYGCHTGNAARPVTERANDLAARERRLGYDSREIFADFRQRVEKNKRDLLRFLGDEKDRGKTIVGYGAPGKGNTLLNYCGIRTDLLSYTVDRNPYKQGHFTPGTRIPILAPETIRETKPDYVLILPWNLRDEIVQQHAYIGDWGAKFVVPIPNVEVVEPPQRDA